jgi:hypothetical protein
MLQPTPLPPLPDAPSAGDIVTGLLGDAFEAVLIDPPVVYPNNFQQQVEHHRDRRGTHIVRHQQCQAERLYCCCLCIWGVPTMHPGQLEVCFCLLHPHLPNSLVVVHWTGGGKTHILRTLGVIERRIILIFIPLLTLSANRPCCAHD